MKIRPFHCLVPLCCLFVIGDAWADDAPMDEASGEPALPSAVDISPADIEFLVGVNRVEEGFERLWRLVDAIYDLGRTPPDVREVLLPHEFRLAPYNFDGPLSIFCIDDQEAPSRYGRYAFGAKWLVTDRAAAEHFLQAPADIEGGQGFRANTQITSVWTKYAAFEENVLTIDLLDRTPRYSPIPRILASAPLTESLPENDCAALAEADAFAVVRGESTPMQEFWDWSLAPPPAESGEARTEEQQVQDDIRTLTQNIEWLTLGISVDFEDEEQVTAAGTMFETSFLLDQDAESDSAALLARLTSDRPATLAGLPAGDPLLAFAGEFAGEERTYYRQLAGLGARYWHRRRGVEDSLSVRRFSGIFEEVGEHLRGMRFAVYRNPDLDGVGTYSVVFIADADDPSAALAELQQMMRAARADEVEVDNPTDAVTDEEIADLVRRLGDRQYRVRRDATNQLLLIGTRATPFLEAALAEESLELRTRASVILDHFATLQNDQARHFFGSDLLEKLHPDYRYVVAGETLSDGTPVDWISISVPEESLPHVPQMEAWLGPDWNRWRIVQTEDHVVVCAGSRAELLDETLSCLREPKLLGLQVAGWSESEQKHQFVLHFDAHEFLSRRSGRSSPPEPDEDPGLMSIGLDLAPDAVRCDLYASVALLRWLPIPFYFGD